jgi:hypothetical protein
MLESQKKIREPAEWNWKYRIFWWEAFEYYRWT